jgi:RNA polymerase sigma factor (sigma-70 family)
MSEAVASASHGRTPGAALRLLGDDRLARRAAQGDREAFAVLYRRHHQALYRYCRAILGNGEDAADALQNTMTAALRALPGDRREIHVKPWLFRIAHNESVSLLRRRAPHADLDAARDVPAAPESDPETRERLRQLVVDLRELQDRPRAALVMRELNGLGYEEIAATLDATPAATRQLVHEARTALHEMAEGRDMQCESVRRSLSMEDRRILRGRKLRAHMRECAGCREFKELMEVRRRDLAAITPALPALAAASLLQGIIGGGQGGGGLLAGLASATAGKVAATSAVGKGVATVAVAASVGAGAAGVTGNLPVDIERKASPDAGASAPVRAPDVAPPPGTRAQPAPGRKSAPRTAPREGRARGQRRRARGLRGSPPALRPARNAKRTRPTVTRGRAGAPRSRPARPDGERRRTPQRKPRAQKPASVALPLAEPTAPTEIGDPGRQEPAP